MKGVFHYAQGLIARGFPLSAIKRARNKFIYEKIEQPAVRYNLTKELLQWLSQQDFSKMYPDEESRREAHQRKALNHYEGTLMCGLVALNHIMQALKLPCLTAKYMQGIARDMADREVALLYGNTSDMNLDLQADPRGNYAVDTLLQVLKEKSSLSATRWIPHAPITSSVLLVGCGQHWQAVLKDHEGQWFAFEKHTAKAIQNLPSFLRGKSTHGAVYILGDLEQLPNRRYLQRFFFTS